MTSMVQRPITPWPTRREREGCPAPSAASAARPAAYVPRHAAPDPAEPHQDVTEQRPRPAVGGAYDVHPQIRTSRNGLGVSAVSLGAIGISLGLIPVTGFVAAGLGVPALAFGIVGWSGARSGSASNPGVAVTGAVLGLIALGLGVVGTIAFVQAPGHLVYDLDALTAAFRSAIAVTLNGG